jgi:hypothetical protein
MSQIEELKLELKKLSAKAVQAKMNLHDLSEDLPVGWETIRDVAEIAFRAYADLNEKRELLKQLETA